MNDKSCQKRRGFIMAVENDLEAQKLTWKGLWDETTVDPIWDALSTNIVHKHAKTFFQQQEHRDEFYVQLEKERMDLVQQRFHMLDRIYLLEKSDETQPCSDEDNSIDSADSGYAQFNLVDSVLESSFNFVPPTAHQQNVMQPSFVQPHFVQDAFMPQAIQSCFVQPQVPVFNLVEEVGEWSYGNSALLRANLPNVMHPDFVQSHLVDDGSLSQATHFDFSAQPYFFENDDLPQVPYGNSALLRDHLPNIILSDPVQTHLAVDEDLSQATHLSFVHSQFVDDDASNVVHMSNGDNASLRAQDDLPNHSAHTYNVNEASFVPSLRRAVASLMSNIQACTDKLKALRKSHSKTIDKHLSLEIEAACKSNNYSLAWKISRQLSARFIGKQKRMFRILRTSRPLSHEWSQFLAQEGRDGGMKTVEVDFDEIKKERNMAPPFFFDCTPELRALALEDTKGIRQSLRMAKRRKAVPEWAAPGEVWWMLFHPNDISNSRLAPRSQEGVGFCGPEPLNVTLFWWYVFSLCVAIRMRRRVPLLWNTSSAVQVPKPGKHRDPNRCKRDRLIHLLDMMGKSYFSHLIRKKMNSTSAPTFSTMTHGYLQHRRREDAIGTIKIMKSRLASHHISHSLSLLDLSNAFGSLAYSQMNEQLNQIVCAEDRDIAQTRYTEVYFFVDCPDQPICFSPGCGGLQGDTFMVYMWLASFSPVIGQWQITLLSHPIALSMSIFVPQDHFQQP